MDKPQEKLDPEETDTEAEAEGRSVKPNTTVPRDTPNTTVPRDTDTTVPRDNT
jgi:hypothetical protein